MNKKYHTLTKASLLGLCLCNTLVSKAQTHELNWVKTVGSTGNELGRCIRTDASGNIYTSGTFTGTVDFDPDAGVTNLTASSSPSGSTFLCKSDATGKLIWAKIIDQGGRIALDAGGNVYYTGNFTAATTDADPGAGTVTLTRKGSGDAYLVKLDPTGNFIWAKQFGGTMQTTLYGISVDGSGNVCLTGYFTGTTDLDPGPMISDFSAPGSAANGFVVKLNSLGDLVWAREFESAVTGSSSGIQLVNDASDNVIITGSLHDTVDFDPGAGVKKLVSAGLADIFVTKLDKDGTFQWAKRMGGLEPDWAFSVTVDKTGAIYATGTMDGKADFDPDGGGYVLTSGGASGSPDVYLAKFSSAGAFQWAKNYGGTLNESSGGVATDAAGDVYLAGTFFGTVNFNTGSSGPSYLISTNTYDGFILKLDKDGNFYWVQQLVADVTPNSASINYITINSSGDILTTGGFQGIVDFDPDGSKTLNVTSAGQNDIFIHKMYVKTSAIRETVTQSFVRIYPNPAQSELHLSFGADKKDLSIRVTDPLGRTVLKEQHISGNHHTLDIGSLAQGIYYLDISDNNDRYAYIVQKR